MWEKIAVGLITEIFKDAYKATWNWAGEQDAKSDYFGLKAKEYGKNIFDQYNYIRVFGMNEEKPLEDLYVRVNILSKITERWYATPEELTKRFDRDRRSFGKVEESQTGLQAINNHQKFVLLGKPGAGKTTYLRYLALQSVHKDSNIKNRKIPVFISLNQFVRFEGSLMDYIVKQFDTCQLEDAAPFIKNILTQGKCLILLDGLDEVPDAKKDTVITQINDLSDKYNTNQYVLTCRIHAYNAAFPRFKDLELADFDDDQKQHFINDWFKKEPEVGKQLWEALKDNTQLLEMASTPVLLTLMCIDYDRNFDLQTNRASIYKSAIEALLIQWDSHRRIKRDEIYQGLTTDRKMQLFSTIAATTFQKDELFIPEQRLTSIIADKLKTLSNVQLDNIETDSKAVLKAIVAQHGILTPRAKGIYSFLHLTFQEYFTSKYIIDSMQKGTIQALISDHSTDDNWKEVFLLTVSSLDSSDNFFKQFKLEIDRFAKSDTSIIRLIGWTKEITEPHSERPIAVRKATGVLITLDRALALDRAIDRAIDRGRDLAFASARARAIALARALDRAPALDLGLDLDRDRALALALDQVITFLEMNVRFAECLRENIAIDPQLKQHLLDTILDFSDEQLLEL